MGSTTRTTERRGSGGGEREDPRVVAYRRTRRRLLVGIGLGALAAVAALFVLFQQNTSSGGSGDGAGGGPRFDVGEPGPGEAAPDFELPSTEGGTWSLTDARGETVLLYFEEGLMCQPCWDQITAIEERMDELEAEGVDQLVSVTSDPLGDLERKVADEGIDTPVLADEDLALAEDYTTNQYGMMGTSRYGHSFILVGPDGEILWRADYGGAPNYTMFVSVDDLLADLRAGLAA